MLNIIPFTGMELCSHRIPFGNPPFNMLCGCFSCGSPRGEAGIHILANRPEASCLPWRSLCKFAHWNHVRVGEAVHLTR